jgi:hypothetical protein
MNGSQVYLSSSVLLLAGFVLVYVFGGAWAIGGFACWTIVFYLIMNQSVKEAK